MQVIKSTLKNITGKTQALFIAAKDPRTPWYAKALALGVVAYLFSPIDIIPDFIPVLGHLDDIIIVPAGIALAVWLIPKDVWQDAILETGLDPKDARTIPWFWVGVFTLLLMLLLIIITGIAFVLYRYLQP
jgi:uncharacterized membrane protein YkvA (DUF1232 family)